RAVPSVLRPLAAARPLVAPPVPPGRGPGARATVRAARPHHPRAPGAPLSTRLPRRPALRAGLRAGPGRAGDGRGGGATPRGAERAGSRRGANPRPAPRRGGRGPRPGILGPEPRADPLPRQRRVAGRRAPPARVRGAVPAAEPARPEAPAPKRARPRALERR